MDGWMDGWMDEFKKWWWSNNISEMKKNGRERAYAHLANENEKIMGVRAVIHPHSPGSLLLLSDLNVLGADVAFFVVNIHCDVEVMESRCGRLPRETDLAGTATLEAISR
jgi:hypothetical protein